MEVVMELWVLMMIREKVECSLHTGTQVIRHAFHGMFIIIHASVCMVCCVQYTSIHTFQIFDVCA